MNLRNEGKALNKKKVCVVTYSHSKNYGAALQLFATYKALEMRGYNPIVLNYVNEFESSNKIKDVLKRQSGLKGKMRAFVSSYLLGSIKNGINNFTPFYSKMHYTGEIHSVFEMGDFTDIDVFLGGSDQVWNPLITGEYDKVFLLADNSIKGKRVSFSSSMGSIGNAKWDDKLFVDSLEKFEKIAVREKIAKDYIKDKINKPVQVTVDPTMLFDKKHWENIILSKKNMVNEKYILVYALGGHFDELNDLAHKIGGKIGAKVAAITLSNVYKKVDYKITTATPEDFVQLVFNAEFVVTNSFHGTCFSIIGETPFYSVYFDSNPKRVEDLLNKYGLSKRLVKIDADYNVTAICIDDIKSANKKIEVDRQDSLKWLEDAIND